MKRTIPASGLPAPSIDACLAEATAQAAAGKSARKAAIATRSGPDRLVVTSPALQAAAQRLLASRTQRATVHVLHVVPGAGWPSVSGWAAAAPAQAKASTTAKTTGGTSTKSTSGTSTSGEWGFLNDTHMSIEDKLFKFMTLVQKKNDKELEDKIKDFKAKYTKAGSSTSGTTAAKSSSSGGIFGFVKQALGAVKLPFGLSLDKLFDQLVGDLGPKLLAMAAIPLGVPALAPAIEKAASAILPKLVEAAGGGSSSSSGTSSSSTSASKEAGSPDEKIDMLEIQRLVEKQNQMFTCISNVMKSMHDTGMSAINNIR
jgi:hypothetical protein